MLKRDETFWNHFTQSYEELLPALRQIDLAELNCHNPVFDESFCEGPLHPENSEWRRYQKTYHYLDELRAKLGHPLQVLDYGMLFGIATLAFTKAGHSFFAVDDFGFYGSSFQPLRDRLARDITIRSVEKVYEIPYEDGFFDVVSLLAVIEHIPDSPKLLLSEIKRVLKPGGKLIIDTPNSASAYKRLLFLLRGTCVFPELRPYWEAENPFTGHHREYNKTDLRTILEWGGFEVEHLEVFQEHEKKNDSLFNLVQNGAIWLWEDWRDYLWGVATRP